MSKKKKIGLIVSFTLILLMILIIFKLSSMNTNNSNGASTNIIGMFIEDTLSITNKYEITSSYPNKTKIERASNLLNPPLRKVMHSAVYLILGILILFFINSLYKNNKYIKSSVLTIIITFLLASLDEYHQTFVMGRTGQFKDVVIDSIGALIGIIIYGTYYYTYRRGLKRGRRELKEKIDRK